MKFFKSDKKQGYTIIIGCGRLGANLANTLSDIGENIAVVDIKKDSFRKLSPTFGGITIQGDASEVAVLVDAEIEKATAVIPVTNNDNTNIMIAQIAKEYFKIPHVIARLYDPEKECVYREFGIDTICPAVLALKEIDKLLHIEETEETVSEGDDSGKGGMA